MSVFRFRVFLEQEDTIYRDVEIKPSQTFADFHKIIVSAFSFDGKHDASFYRSNDNWIQGQEIALKKKADTKKMDKVLLANFIDDPHIKLVYVYDYDAEWLFLVELMGVEAELKKTTYPRITKTEGVSPKQYGAQPIVGGDESTFEAVEIFEEHEANDMGELGEEGESSEETDEAEMDEEGNEPENESDEF